MMAEKINITTPFIKLDSFLKLSGVVSTGGEAKALIKDSQILVNNEACLMRGKKLYPGYLIRALEKDYEVISL